MALDHDEERPWVREWYSGDRVEDVKDRGWTLWR